MPPAMPEPPDDIEEQLRRDIALAGDPLVVPRPEHIARLRAVILARLEPPRPARRWKAPLLVGSGLAAAAVIVALMSLGRPAVAWAQVAKAMRERPWVHGRVSGPDGTLMSEHWLSSDRQRAAERGGPSMVFHDVRGKVLTKYVGDEGVIYRLAEPPEGTAGEVNFLRQLLDGLLDPAGPARFPFPGSEVVGETRREIKGRGKTWIEVVLTLRIAGGSRGGPLAMRIRVDAETKLPESMAMEAEDGKTYTALIDYPERGPADVYDLGAPRTAKVVDRMVPANVAPVVAALRAGRRDFDDYCAFVVEQRILPTYYFPRVTVYRVWRKGLRWRIERLRPKRVDWAPPDNADLAWWNAHQGEFTFVPVIICNGQVYWDYYLADTWAPGMPVPKPGRPNEHGQTVGPNQFMGPVDDPIIPFWCQELLPEQAGHPTAGIYQPDFNREFKVEERGPDGRVLFRGVDPTPREGAAYPDHFRLSLDPATSYLAMKSELRVSDAADHSKVAYIGTRMIESVARSPGGRHYPTRTRQLSHSGAHEVVCTFAVDFKAQVPDGLFEPLN